MKIDQWRRFSIASIVLSAIFFINLYGLYGDGFAKKYYFVPETEHLVAAFFLAMWLSVFSRSPRFIIAGLIIVTIFWEGLEYYIATVPSATKAVQGALKITDTAVDNWDTALDVFLNLTGASIFIFLMKKFKW